MATYVNAAGKKRAVFTAEQAVKARHDGFREKRTRAAKPAPAEAPAPATPSTDDAAK